MARHPPHRDDMERRRVRRGAHWRVQMTGPGRTVSRRVRVAACWVVTWRPKPRQPELPFDRNEEEPK